MVDICWLVVGSGGFILADSGWWWVMVDIFWLMVDIFWLVVTGDG